MAKILIIDDDKIIRERLQKLLSLEGYETLVAENGINGLKLMRENKPDVVLLDIKMPGVEGPEVLQEIKGGAEEVATAEVIVITGHGGIDTAIEALKGGAFGYIQKPIEFDELEIEIRKALEKQEMQRKINGYVHNLEHAVTELKKAKSRAEVANQSKSQFLATVSHEIRTPMTAILGFVDLLKGTALNDKQSEYLDTILSSSQTLLTILNDILDISKVEAGELKIEHIDFNLQHLLDDMVKFIKLRLKGKPIQISFSMGKDVPVNLEGDPTRIRQILLNLLNNAVKFTEEGEIGLSVNLEKRPDDERRVLRFAVTDTGIGIPRDKRESIFDTFTQVDMSTTRKYGGTGLGLAICRKLVKLMNGEIWVESETGKGSRFIFTVEFKEKPRLIDRDIAPLSKADLKDKKVLIVDDNQPGRQLFCSFCEEVAMKVHPVSSAQEALTWLSDQEQKGELPDIILVDIMMPDIDGYGFIRNVKMNPSYGGIKLVALSSIRQVGLTSQMQESGFDAFLTKPIQQKEVFNVICAVLGDKRDGGQIITRHMAEELSCKGIKVLVAEDNPLNQKFIGIFLDNLGCIIDLVNDGNEAIKMIQENKYDICLMDLQMPVMDGITATKAIRESGNNVLPIIAITASTMAEDGKKALSSGMNDYLLKPIDTKSLKEKIYKWGKQ